jgi:hypothetical protein
VAKIFPHQQKLLLKTLPMDFCCRSMATFERTKKNKNYVKIFNNKKNKAKITFASHHDVIIIVTKKNDRNKA